MDGMRGVKGGRTHDRKVDLPTFESPSSRTVVSIGGGPRGGSSMVRYMDGCMVSCDLW